MTSKFSRRVQVERKVLSLVNNSTSHRAELAGLSSKSIDNWKLRVGISNADEVAKILHNIDKLCAHVSRSGETFQDVDPKVLENLESEIEKLQLLLPC
jgi:hypothetical protein